MPTTAPKPLFQYQIDVAANIRACLRSGVELTQAEQDFLSSFQSFRKPTQDQYRLFWDLCKKCNVT